MQACLTDTGLVLAEARRMADIDSTEWNVLTESASLYSSHPWLSYVEHFGDCDLRYLLVRRGGRLVGALPCGVFHGDVPRYYDPGFLFGTGESPRPLVLGGTRQGYATELLLAPDLQAADRAAVVRLLLDRLRALRDETGGQAALLYLTDAALDELGPLLGVDDQVLLIDARARLDVDATGLDGYRARVSTNTSARMRKEMRRFSDAGCTLEVSRLSECHGLLGALSAPVLQRYGQAISAEEESSRFAAQAASLDDICRVLLARRGGEVVGFTQFFLWRDQMVGRVHGLDDSVARTAALYYNLTYYHAIDYAARHGFTGIDLGCDSYEAKVRRGARLEPLWGLVLDAAWDRSTTDRLRAAEYAKFAEFREWDEHVLTPTAHRKFDQREGNR